MPNMQMQNRNDIVDVDKLAALIKKVASASIIMDAIYAGLNIFLAAACYSVIVIMTEEGQNLSHLWGAVAMAGITVFVCGLSIYEESRVLFKKKPLKSSGIWPYFNLYIFVANIVKIGFIIAELTASDANSNGVKVAKSPAFIMIPTCLILLVYSIVRGTLILTLMRLFNRA